MMQLTLNFHRAPWQVTVMHATPLTLEQPSQPLPSDQIGPVHSGNLTLEHPIVVSKLLLDMHV